MSVNNPAVRYLPNLDVLRFLLAVFVLVFHVPEISKNSGLPFYNNLPVFHRGTEAVYWFFVLSGFLLSHLANNEVKMNRFNVARFFLRRVLRIWPLYFLVSFFGLFFYYFILPLLHIPFENQADFGTAFLLAIFFLSNILHAFYDPGSILSITWSVSVEEQFYLFFPLLVYLVYRKQLLKRVSMVSLFALICSLYFLLPSTGDTIQRLGLHIELFLIGMMAAEFFEMCLKLSNRIKNGMLLCALILFSVLFFTDWLLVTDNPFLWRLINGIVAAIVVLALGSWQKNCNIQWLILGGKVSYGIYMYHMIVITGVIFVVQKLPVKGNLVVLFINLISMVISYLLALGSFRFFESKFLRMKKY